MTSRTDLPDWTVEQGLAPVPFDKAGYVPAWTPEDEGAFRERLSRTVVVRNDVGPVDPVTGYALAGLTPPTQLSFSATLGIAKRHRATCPACGMRRVLFSIIATGNLFGGSEPRCAKCWGLR